MRNDVEHLRLVWPQWQGAGSTSVRDFAETFPEGVIRHGYAVGADVLQAILPPHPGPTVVVPTGPDGAETAERAKAGLEMRDGIEAKDAVLAQLRAALDLIARHAPRRITTLGGDCSVSVAPFAWLAHTYGDDLAVIWIDSHPDVDTGDTRYAGYHAMAVSMLTGHGDRELHSMLPDTVPAARLALAGVHSWTDDAFPHVAQWGLPLFSPAALRRDSACLLDWLASTGATRVAIHFDVDTIDAAEMRLGLGEDFGGLTGSQARRVVRDLAAEAEVVGFTIAEFIPRDVLRVQQLVAGFPL